MNPGGRPGGWIAIAVRHARDPKVQGLSPGARCLWLDALCWSGEQEADGRIPGNLREISGHRDARTVDRLTQSLLDRGLWIRTPDGGLAVPFDAYNRWQVTHDQRESQRAKERERQARWRARHGGSNPGRNGGSNGQIGAGVGLRPTTPADDEIATPEMWEDSGGHLFVNLDREDP